MKNIVAIVGCIFFVNILAAQNTPCEVLVESLKGVFEGDCKKGKADGMGKAIGTDTYEGSFKNGLPDGIGTYTWKNGDIFTGAWKKGLKDGKGKMYIKGSDSTVDGFWKKNMYKSKYENPYEVLTSSSKITHEDINKIDLKGTTVTVSMESGLLGSANVDDFQVLAGSYDHFNKREMTKSKAIEFQGVVFPFRVKFGIGGSPFEFELFEPGDWLVNINL